jgi:hypothetical protein
MATQVSGASRWLTLNGVPLRFGPGTINTVDGVREYKESQFRITEAAPDDVEIRVDSERLVTERYGRWIWRPAGFAGLYDVEVSAPNHGVHKTQVRVLPGNITLRQQARMYKDITDISVDLLFQLHTPAREYVGTISGEAYQSPLRSYRLIENLVGELEKALTLIVRSPHRVLIGHQERRQWHEPAAVGANASPIPGPSVAIPASARAGVPRVLPRVWLVERGELTHDVYENRLLKHFLWSQLLTRLMEIEDSAEAEIQRRAQNLAFYERRGWDNQITEETVRIAELEHVIKDVNEFQRKVVRWGNLPFLRWVNHRPVRAVPTQVLQKDPGYSRFYKVYLRFQQELRWGVTAERLLTQLATRKMSEIYETWSIFRITDVLLPLLTMNGYSVVSETGFYRLDDRLFHFEVDRDAVVELVQRKTRLCVRYEPTYPHWKGTEGLVTPRYPRLTPDLAVERWEDGEPQAVLIFDAKYKSEIRDGRKTYWEVDLNKMSVYYSEILWKASESGRRPEQIVSSAYILYPGDVLNHDPEYPMTGALPVVPGTEGWAQVRKVLLDLLRNGDIVNGEER